MSRPRRRGATRAVAEVVAAAALFGTTGTSANLAPAAAGPVAIGAARLVVGGAGLVALIPLLGGDRRRAAGLLRTRWGLAAGLMTAAYQLAFFAGVALAGVALATLVTIGAGPVLVGLLSWLLLGERPARAWWTATGLCVGGLALLVLGGNGPAELDPTGLLLALAASGAYALYTVAARRLIHGAGAHPAEVMASCFGLGAIVLAPVLVLAGTAWLAEPTGLAVACWLGLGTTTAAYVLFGRGLAVLPAGPAATLVLAEPLVATLLGVGLLGERLAPAGWAGALLVATGLVLQGAAAARRADVA